MTTSRGSCNKGPCDGTGRKRLCHSFAVQRDKVVKKRKVELCKLKVKAEQTVLGKRMSSVYNLYVPHKKADRSRKMSEDVRIEKKPPSTSTETVHHDRPVTKKSNTLSRTCEEKYKEGYKEFSKKNQHDNKHTSHCSTESNGTVLNGKNRMLIKLVVIQGLKKRTLKPQRYVLSR